MQQLAEKYMNLLMKRVRGEVLSPRERGLLADVQALDELMPGSVAEEMLRYSLGPVPARSSLESLAGQVGEAAAVYGVAADTGSSTSSLYQAVMEAAGRGEKHYSISLGTETVPLLDIMAERQMVAPKYVPEYEFVIERRGQDAQTVGRHGGIFVDTDELSQMELEIDLEGKTLRLHTR